MQNLIEEIQTYSGLIVYEISYLKFCTDIAMINNIQKLNEVSICKNYYESKLSEVTIKESKYPLLNLQSILECKGQPFSEDSRLLMYDSNNYQFFFLVNKIFHIRTNESHYNQAPIIESSISSKYIKGAIKFEDSEQYIIDFEKIAKELEIKNNIYQK